MNIEENKSLRSFNTFGINAQAQYFAEFGSQEELGALLKFPVRTLPLLVLGGGSNILLTKDFAGFVLKNNMRGIDLIREDQQYVYVRVGAGENWHQFVQVALQRNWAGLENLSLIPGNVGASPMQNIGAYGVEIKEVFEELEAWHLVDNKVYTFTLNDCDFGYRDSIFKREHKGQFVILSVVFRLNKIPEFHTEYGSIGEELEKMGVQDLSIQAISEAVTRIRRSKLPDPAEIGNAGSFFKNPTVSTEEFARLRSEFPGIVGYPNAAPPSPQSQNPQIPTSAISPDPGVKLAAGWLIEQCGWKGVRRGDAGVHTRQALVLVNYRNASGQQIYDLSEEILQSIREKFGVTLEREVNIVPQLS